MAKIFEYCTLCNYEREYDIPDKPIKRDYRDECPECSGFLEREFDSNLVLKTILLSESAPGQSGAGRSGMAWQEGTNANIYWSFSDQSFGYFFFGVGRDGNAFEGDDNDGYASQSEAEQAARDEYQD